MARARRGGKKGLNLLGLIVVVFIFGPIVAGPLAILGVIYIMALVASGKKSSSSSEYIERGKVGRHRPKSWGKIK